HALRVIADPEPREAVGGNPSRDSRLAPIDAVSFPLQGSGAAGAGSWRLAVDRGDSGLGVGAVRRAPEPLPERTAGVRAAVRVPAFLLPVLRDRHSSGGRVLVRQRTAGGLRRVAAAALDRAAGELPVLHPAAGGQPVLPVAAPGAAALRPLLLRSRSSDIGARRRTRRRVSQRARVGYGRREPGR